MVILKNARELGAMMPAGRISAAALKAAEHYMRPGVTTKEIDEAIAREIVGHGAKASFLGYNGFPASSCISVNDEVIHGIPSHKTVLKDGDIVSVDVGAYYDGFHGDNAYTFVVGAVSEEAQKLIRVTSECLLKGIEQVRPGNRIGDISNAVETHARANGFGVVKMFVGHGIGRNIHEEPEVPNYGIKGRGLRIVPGMVLCVEPMINLVGDGIKQMPDGWTYKTASGSLSAHFEHTIAVTSEGIRILTKL